MPGKRGKSDARQRPNAQKRGESPSKRAPKPVDESDPRRLEYQLQVHRAELAMQTDELQVARDSAEAGLRRYAAVFEHAPIGYVILSMDGEITEVNAAAADLFECGHERLLGQQFATFISLADREVLIATTARAQVEASPQTCEVQLRPLGAVTLVRAKLVISYLEPEQLVLIAVEDITERRAYEQRLVDAERELREANGRKDEFLAMLSHELRNPLTPIHNSLYVLASSSATSAEGRRALDVIERQTAHIAHMVEDLLDVTRISRGKIHLNAEHCELSALVANTCEDHRGAFELEGVELQVGVEPKPLWVWGDPTRLRQVINNLLGNALKFTPHGGRVTVTLEGASGRAVLKVRDTGVGINPIDQLHMFEPFAQGPQALDRSKGGLGLGLAMVKGLVELQGGSVQVHSEGRGQGTEAQVVFPLRTEPQPRASAAHAPLRVQRRVLVVDDNTDVAESLRDVLSMLGHSVEVANDGAAAIERARAFHPEVVLCDIGLPGMDGYAVARAMREDPSLKQTFLVALSGYARPEDRKNSAAAGFDRHLAKPPTIQELDVAMVASTQRTARPPPPPP